MNDLIERLRGPGHNDLMDEAADALEQVQAEVELWKQRALSEDTPTERMIERLEAWESTARGAASDVIAMAKALREIHWFMGDERVPNEIRDSVCKRCDKALQIAGDSSQ